MIYPDYDWLYTSDVVFLTFWHGFLLSINKMDLGYIINFVQLTLIQEVSSVPSLRTAEFAFSIIFS